MHDLIIETRRYTTAWAARRARSVAVTDGRMRSRKVEGEARERVNADGLAADAGIIDTTPIMTRRSPGTRLPIPLPHSASHVSWQLRFHPCAVPAADRDLTMRNLTHVEGHVAGGACAPASMGVRIVPGKMLGCSKRMGRAERRRFVAIPACALSCCAATPRSAPRRPDEIAQMRRIVSRR